MSDATNNPDEVVLMPVALSTWAVEMREHIHKFMVHYQRERAAAPEAEKDTHWPKEMFRGDWDECFDAYMELHGGGW